MSSTLITSPDELSDYEEGWEALRRSCGGTYFASLPMIRTWLEVYEKFASPRVLLIENGGDLVGIAPMATYSYKVKGLPIKVLSLVGDVKYRLRLATNTVMYDPDRGDVLDQIIMGMKKLDWNILWTIHMPKSTAVDRYIDRIDSTWSVVSRTSVDDVDIPLPIEGDPKKIYHRNARKNITGNENRLEREGHDVEFRKVPASEIERAVDVYAAQHIERWEAKGGSYFKRPENVIFLKKAMTEALGSGHGIAYEFLIDGQIAAQEFGFIDGDRAFSYRTGMNNAFSKYSPGRLLSLKVFTDLRDRGFRSCSIGWGGEAYKSEIDNVLSPLLGVGASRGAVSLVTRALATRPGQFIDSRLRLTKGAFSVNDDGRHRDAQG